MLVSVNTNGLTGNGVSHNAAMTPDAHFIAFSSAASDLVPSDTNGIPDVFVRDCLANTTELASVGALSTGSIYLPSTSESPDISSDGSLVAFYTTATNLLPGQTTAGHVFVRNQPAATTVWVSSNAPNLFLSAYGTTNAISCSQRISADGKYVAFEACTNHSAFISSTNAAGIILRYALETGVTDLVATNATVPSVQFEDINMLDVTPDGRYVAFVTTTNTSPSLATCVNLWDGQSGATSLISQNLTGGVSANDACLWPRMDSSGRYVAFLAAASDLTTNSVSGYNCYLRDTQAGTTTLVNVDTNGIGAGVNSLTPPAICGDGHLVAFVCSDGNLVANDDNSVMDVFARDCITNTTELVSRRNPAQPDGSTGFSSGFSTFSVSSNGLFVAFTSEGSFVANDTNNMRDVYLADILNQTNILISVNTNGVAANCIASEPSIDATGRYVAFSSLATDLIPNDTNNSFDVFVRDSVAGTTTLASQNADGSGEGNADSYTPTVSASGRYVLFYSLANNLAAGTFSGGNLFLRDTQLSTNYALTLSGAGSAFMTPDGGRVAFVDGGASKLYVWDTSSAERIYTNNLASTAAVPSLSADGNLVAWFDGWLKVANLTSNTVAIISRGLASTRAGAHFSGDGRFLTYAINTINATDINALADVYVYDFQSGASNLISRGFNSVMAASGTSDSPAISSDGRFIAYRSLASNNVVTDLNGVPDLMLYDRSNAVTLLITASVAGNRTANNRSMAPAFSADGKNLVFSSWASDLQPHDFNQGSDVFVLPLPGSSITGQTNANTGMNWVSGLQMFQPPNQSAVPAFSWPAQSGVFYLIQFKDDLSDPVWHDLNGSASVSGNLGTAYDLNAAPDQRFYRVMAGN